jgi:hypothetical protein
VRVNSVPPATWVREGLDFQTLSANGVGNAGLGAYLPITASIVQDLRARAIANANSRTRNATAGWGENIAQAHHLQNLIVDTAGRLAKGLRAVRRGRFLEAARSFGLSDIPKGTGKSKALADNWLAYRYGWAPLLSDVYGSMVALYEYHRRKHIGFASGHASTTYNEGWITSNYGYGSTYYDSSSWYKTSQDGAFSVKKRRSYELSYHVGYIYRVTNANAALSQSLGLSDPVSVAWELVPFSFVADWFVNVGDVLEQIGVFTGKEFITGYETYVCKVLHEAEGGFCTPYLYTILSQRNAKAGKMEYYMERKVLSTQPTFGLHLNNGFSWKRSLDAISLLRQAFH